MRRNEKNPKAPPSWSPALTKETHHKPSSGMRASRHGYIGVMTSDGHLSIHDSGSLNEITRKRKLHNMPITSLCFKEDEG